MEKEQFLSNIHACLKLLGLYLNKKEAPDLIIDKNQLSFFVKLSKHHSLRAILYKALIDTKVQVDPECLAKLEEYYLLTLRKAVLFEKERNELYQYLNDHKIDFLPLKGIILKDYYLDSYSREFADNDILFKDINSALIKAFFVKKGYTVEVYKKSNHDVYIKKPFFNFEMHRALFYEREDNKAYIPYFDKCLDNAPIKENYEHYLSNNDFYIYFTAHTYKHFHVSGCGIRTLIDYYLYLKKETLDFDYINKELDKLGLLEFSNQIKTLTNKLFNDEPLTNEEEDILLFIASSGTYGTLAHSVDKGVKEKGKFRYFMSRVFPPYKFYKSAYPWAYYFPLLIPIAWLCRFFRILFKNPKRANSELKMISKHQDKEKTSE